MKYQQHLMFGTGIVIVGSILNYNNILNIDNVLILLSKIFNFFSLNSQLTYIDNGMILLFLISYIFFNIINDLDTPFSLIGKIFFFISIPSWLLSVFLYRILYPKSWNGVGNIVGNGLNGFIQKMKLRHRLVFHTEIGIIFLLFLMNNICYYFNISNDYHTILNISLVLGYISHLLADSISGKLPYPITIRLLFIIFNIKKETYGI